MSTQSTLTAQMSPIKRFWNRQIRVHRYFKITGGYRFIGKNLLRLLAFLVLFTAAAWAINEYVIDFTGLSKSITEKYSPVAVVTWLFASEVILGVLPPEAFILWAQSFSQPYAMVFLLASVSYAGGLISFFIGSRLYHFSRIHKWVDEKFASWIVQIKRYGGLLIGIAALTPLPYPLISMIAGLSGVKKRVFMTVALIRYVRFFIWALVLFKAI